MGLENAQWIPELVDTNPVTATDPVSEGSNHLRMLKLVLQNTFPNFIAGEPINLSSSELDDAAIKSLNNIFTADQTLINAVSLYGQNFVGIAQPLIGMTASDRIALGDAAGNVDVAGTLSLADSGGALQPVARLSGAAQTFSSLLTFSAQTTYTANQVLGNGIQLSGLETGAAVRALAFVDGSNVITFGDALNSSAQLFSVQHALTAGADAVARFVSRAGGSLVVNDLGGVERKAGFRNPGYEEFGATDQAAAQAWEGTVKSFTPTVSNDCTLGVLEANTTFRILNRGEGFPLNILEGIGVAISWFDGAGAAIAGDRILAGNSVLEVYYPTTNTVTIFGNGVS